MKKPLSLFLIFNTYFCHTAACEPTWLGDLGVYTQELFPHLALDRVFVAPQEQVSGEYTDPAEVAQKEDFSEYIDPTNKKRCLKCEKEFQGNSSLKAHIRFGHINPRSFLCTDPNCGAKFDSKGSLKQHIERCHCDPRNKFSCDQCSASFKKKDGLSWHTNRQHPAK